MVSNNVQLYVNYILRHFIRNESVVENGFPNNVNISTSGPYVSSDNMHIVVRFPCNDIDGLRTWRGYMRQAIATLRLALLRIGHINFQLLLTNQRNQVIDPSFNAFNQDNNLGRRESADRLMSWVINTLSQPVPVPTRDYDITDDWTGSGNTLLIHEAGFNLADNLLTYRIVIRIDNDQFNLFTYRLRNSLNLIDTHVVQAQVRENNRLLQIERDNDETYAIRHDISPSVSDSDSSDDNLPLINFANQWLSEDELPLAQYLRRRDSSDSDDWSTDDDLPLRGLFANRPVSPSDLVPNYDRTYQYVYDSYPEDTTSESSVSTNGDSSLNDMSDDAISIVSSVYYRMLSSSSGSSSSSASSSSSEDSLFENATYYPNRLISFEENRRFIPRTRENVSERYNLRTRLRTNPAVLAHLRGFTRVGRGLRRWRPSSNRNTMMLYEKLSFQKLRR